MSSFVFQQNKFIFVFAGLMILAGVCWFGYRLLNEAFLTETEIEGKVIGKQHAPMSEKRMLQNIGGTHQYKTVMVPEMWLLNLDIDGEKAQASVDPDEFNTFQVGAAVRVQVLRQRLSGKLEVTRFLGAKEY